MHCNVYISFEVKKMNNERMGCLMTFLKIADSYKHFHGLAVTA